MNGILFTRTVRLSLSPFFYRFLFIIKPMASLVGWGKVHAYKVGPDSDNIRNAVQIEMWLIAIHRMYNEFDLRSSGWNISSYIRHSHPHLHTYWALYGSNACREKKKSFFFWSLYSFSIHFYSWTFVYGRPSLSHELIKILWYDQKCYFCCYGTLLCTLDLTGSHLNNGNTYTFIRSNSVRLFISVSFLPIFLYISVYFRARQFIC